VPDLSGFAGLTLLQPWALLLVPISLLVLVVRALWRRRRYVALPTAGLLPAQGYRPSVIRRLPLVFGLAGVGAIAVALADPVVPHSTADLRSLGIDIVLVMDLSSSMNTEMGGSGPSSPDAPKGPTRLDVTKAALRAPVGSRHGDRLARWCSRTTPTWSARSRSTRNTCCATWTSWTTRSSATRR
jgi:hypothetical protein